MRIAAVVPTGQARWFMTDQVDSVSLVTDDVGNSISAIDYLPYGETWYQQGDTGFSPKYNSQELDKESWLYFFNARHYDPEIARFETADSVVDGEYDAMGWNRYTYTHGNPIRYKDPTGHVGVPSLFEWLGKKFGPGNSDAVKQEEYGTQGPARAQAYKNFKEFKDEKGNITERYTVVDGIRFNLDHKSYKALTGRDSIKNMNDKIWENITIAAKENHIKIVNVSALIYANGISHTNGNAMDITSVTDSKGNKAIFDRKLSKEGESALAKNFTDSFNGQPGSYMAWTPWRMKGDVIGSTEIENRVGTQSAEQISASKQKVTEYFADRTTKPVPSWGEYADYFSATHVNHGHFAAK